MSPQIPRRLSPEPTRHGPWPPLEADGIAPATPCSTRQRRPARPPVGLTLLLLLLLLLPPSPALALNDAQELVVEAWRLVNQSYVDPARLEAVHWRQLRQKALEKSIERSDQAYDAISAMLEPIGDPYTRLLRPADFGSLRSNTLGTVSGVGLQLALRHGDDQIIVISPLDASPAADAGVGSGWEVLSVDGTPTASLGLEGTAAALRGPAGSDVLVGLRPPGQKARELQLRRRDVDLQPVRSRRLTGAASGLGYLRITQFSEPVPQQVREALQSLTAGPPLQGVILDLRNNSGGLVSAGLSVADELLSAAPIVETQDRNGIADRPQAGSGSLYDGPLLTLVNGGTASASEILAGALQDAGRSRLAGSRTFGKGLIQTLIPLSDGSGLAVTVARYLTPDGRDIQDLGIEPDLPLRGEEPLNPGGEGDSWLTQAASALLSTVETTPLDGVPLG